jgi:hypothetical protein
LHHSFTTAAATAAAAGTAAAGEAAAGGWAAVESRLTALLTTHHEGTAARLAALEAAARAQARAIDALAAAVAQMQPTAAMVNPP